MVQNMRSPPGAAQPWAQLLTIVLAAGACSTGVTASVDHASPPPLPPCAADAPRAWPRFHVADWDLRLTNASLCCTSGHRPPCSGPCSETNPMGGLGAHDVNALFSYGGLAHVMNQRQIEQSVEGKAGFSHLVSRDWVRWQRLPNALAAGSYDGSATVVPGSGPVIMFDCATKICPSGSNILSSSVGATSADSGTADVQQHPDDIPVMGVARPHNLSDPTLREWVTAAANPIVIDIPGEYVAPSKLWHNSSGVAFMTMNSHDSVIGLFSSVDPQLHHWHLEDPKWFATGGGGAVVFLPLPTTVSGDHLVGANGTNHVCGSCDPSLCFILGHFDPDTDQSFTQTIPGKHCTDMGYDMGGFFVYSESGIVPPEAFGHPTASPDWGKAKTRFVQQGWIADLAALTVVRELRYDPVQQSLVSLPVAELASLREALLTNFSGKTLAAGQPVLTVANGSVATVADIEIDIEMPKGAAAFKVDIGALGAHIQLACSPASASHPVAGCTLFAPGRGRGKTTRQSYNLGPGETATSLRVLVDKVVLEVFAGGGRSTATVATDKRGVDPSTAVISVGLSVGQATLAGRVWSMECGWVADVQQQEIALKTDDTDEQAKIVLVSPTGVQSTAPDGTMLVSSVHEARDAARSLMARHGPGRGVIVQLLPGQHHIGGSTLELGPLDSGVVWRGSLDPAAAAVVTAAVAVYGWKADAARPGVLTAPIPATVPAGKALRHLWVGGVRAFKPRYYPPAMAIVVVENSSMPHGSLLPNGGYLFNASAMDPSTFRNPRNVEFVYTGRTGARAPPPAGYAHDHERGAQSGEDPWTEMRCTVDTVRGRSVSLKRACWEALPFAGAEDTHARSVRHQPPAYLENVEAIFTEPGEWYLDSEAGSILYRPRVGETLADVEKSAMTAVNSTLLVLKDARDVVYEGVQFEYAVWDPLTTDQQGFVDIQSAQIFNGSVIAASTLQLSGVRNVSFISCNFRHLGGVYALTAEGGSQGVKIENCTFVDCSGGGVKFGSVANCSEGCANGGPSPAGSNPGAHSGKGNQWWPSHQTPSEEQDAGLVVTNSWFDSIPTEFHGANAVFVGYAKDVEISHNTIRNTSYSAICIGGGWPKKPSYGKNVQVTYNRITNAMQLLADGGFIYSTSDGVNSTLAYNHMDGDPVQYGGLYHDGGSANWHDTQNVIENVKSSRLEGAFKTDDIGEQDDTGGTEPLAVPAIVVDAVDSGDSSAQELDSTALAAENQQLRSEVRLLRQLLAAGAGAGSRRALAPTQAQAGVAAKPQRRTLQDLLPSRNSPFRKYLFLNESIFDGAPRHARTTFNPPTNLGAVIKPDRVWEAGIYPFAQVVQFGNEIRVYYHCQGDTPLGTFLVPMLCLAISTDGRSFVKPDFGAVPFNGSKHNNIVMCPVMNGESCDVGAQKSGWYPPGPVWLDPRSGVPPSELWKSTGGNGNLVVSADGIHFRTTSRQVMQHSDWNTWAMIFDEDALPSDGSNCENPGEGTPGRFVAYGRSDDPGNAQLPGHPKVCGDLAGMRAVIRQQSIDGNHTECTNSKLVFPAWDDTDPQPLLNGAPLTWSDTKDASCAGASEAQRIASSQDGRSPWNDVYYTFPVKYGADFLFYIPILRHFQ